jgi:hypothetical protein
MVTVDVAVPPLVVEARTLEYVFVPSGMVRLTEPVGAGSVAS